MNKKVIIDTGLQSAQENMLIDERLLSSIAKTKECILHFYDWESFSITHGHFIDITKFFNLKEISRSQVQLAKRPTGGGIVFHHCDFVFSFLIPSESKSFSKENILSNYATINNMVIKAFCEVFGKKVSLAKEDFDFSQTPSRHFCMAQPTKYDIVLNGKKIGGAAQRKVAHGFLHQGSILLGSVSKDIFHKFLLSDVASIVYQNSKNNSFSVLGDNWIQDELLEARRSFKDSLSNIFMTESLM